MQVRAALQQLALQRNTQVLRTLSAPTETHRGYGGTGGRGRGGVPFTQHHVHKGVNQGQNGGVGGGEGHGNVHIITSGRFCRLIPKAHTVDYLRDLVAAMEIVDTMSEVEILTVLVFEPLVRYDEDEDELIDAKSPSPSLP